MCCPKCKQHYSGRLKKTKRSTNSTALLVNRLAHHQWPFEWREFWIQPAGFYEAGGRPLASLSLCQRVVFLHMWLSVKVTVFVFVVFFFYTEDVDKLTRMRLLAENLTFPHRFFQTPLKRINVILIITHYSWPKWLLAGRHTNQGRWAQASRSKSLVILRSGDSRFFKKKHRNDYVVQWYHKQKPCNGQIDWFNPSMLHNPW